MCCSASCTRQHFILTTWNSKHRRGILLVYYYYQAAEFMCLYISFLLHRKKVNLLKTTHKRRERYQQSPGGHNGGRSPQPRAPSLEKGRWWAAGFLALGLHSCNRITFEFCGLKNWAELSSQCRSLFFARKSTLSWVPPRALWLTQTIEAGRKW